MKTSRALLKRVQGYSIYWRCLPLFKQRMGVPSQTEQWVETIAARYKFCEQRWPILVYELAQITSEGDSILNQNHTHYAPVLVNPRMLLRLLINHQHTSPQLKPVRREILQHSDLTKRGNTNQPALLNIHQEKIDIVTRILLKSERLEKMPTAPNRTIIRPSSPESNNAIPNAVPGVLQTPVSKVFRQGSVIPQGASTTANAPTGLNSSATFPSGMTANPQIPTVVDIGRLTDQVMQALDNRIIAQRERLGRV